MAYLNFQNCTKEEYEALIYSQEDQNDIKIWFNDIELDNAGYYVEKISCKSRILPDDGNKAFTLGNFIAKEVEITFHNVDTSIMQDQVDISIGTYINNAYEYVPLGVFNIQETPKSNNNKVVLKLRDNRVKFDFNYNAQFVIEDNGGSATYKQILDDICSQAGVVCDVETFDGDDLETGMYDNSITATAYVSYIAEQGGYVPVITREGHLDFADLTQSTVWRIPLSVVSDNYKKDKLYYIQRVIYESGIIKFVSGRALTNEALYLSASNPFVINQAQVDNIHLKFTRVINDTTFRLDSVALSTAILGNPAIDPWDIIEVYDDVSTTNSKNLLDISLGYELAYKSNVNIWTPSYNNALFRPYVSVTPGETYTFSVNHTIADMVVSYFNENKEFIGRKKVTNTSKVTITMGSNVKLIKWCINYNDVGVTDKMVADSEPMIEVGSTRTTYEPYYAVNSPVFVTLGNTDYVFNGKHRDLFTTVIGEEQRIENVSLKEDATYRKSAKTEIDQLNAQIKLQAENTRLVQENINNLQNDISDNYYNKSTVEQMIINAESGVTNTFSEAGGNNILRNTDFSAREVLELGQIYEYWFGNTIRNTNTSAVNGYSVLLQDTFLYQDQNVSNGNYTLSFMYKKLNPLATCKVIINDNEYELTNDEYTLFQTGIDDIDPISIATNKIRVGFESDAVNSCEIYDIMLNIGTIKLAYSQNANEVKTDTVNISKGITITSSTSEVKFTANNDGIRTLTLRDEIITEFTDKGTKTKELEVENQATIVGILRQRVGNQVWDSLI